MGTDAHALVEVKHEGLWHPFTIPIWPNDRNSPVYGQRPAIADTPGLARNYGLYSLLADVRNRTGRNGAVMMKAEVPDYGEIEFEYDMDDGGHDPITPIDMPRGLPEGVNPGWKEFTDQDAIHDATWLLASELRQGNPCYDQRLYEDCVVSEEEYAKFAETGVPPAMQPHAGGGPGVRVVTEPEYLAGERGENGTLVHIRWVGKTLAESLPSSWWATVAAMVLVAPDHDLDRVRLLVAFDS